MSSLKSNGKKQHHYGGAGSYSENSNQKMIMSIVGIFCFIVLIWFVYRRGQETCPVSSTSGTRASGTRAGRKANMMRAGAGGDPCDVACQGGDPNNYALCASCVNINTGNTNYALVGQPCIMNITNCVLDPNAYSDTQCVASYGSNNGICTDS